MVGMTRLDDFPDRQRAHGRADLDRRRIISAVGDPASHRRLDREELVSDEYLPVRWGSHRDLANGEIVALRHSRGPGNENCPTIDHAGLMPNVLRARP